MSADLDCLEEMYAFARARADTAAGHEPRKVRRAATSHLRWLQTAYAKAKQAETNAALAAAIDVFLKATMRAPTARPMTRSGRCPQSNTASQLPFECSRSPRC